MKLQGVSSIFIQASCLMKSIVSKDGGVLLKDNFEGGVTWAYEVGSKSYNSRGSQFTSSNACTGTNHQQPFICRYINK
ncbi:putative transcription factor LHW [Helianthus anomalus]